MSLWGGGECRERGSGEPGAGAGGRQVPGRVLRGEGRAGLPGGGRGWSAVLGAAGSARQGIHHPGPNQLILINCQQ